LLLRALSEGRNFGDAVYYALPVLSWQAVAIGDPLYRPFKVSLAEQLSRVSTFTSAQAAQVWLRQGNVLALRGQKGEAREAYRAAQRRAEEAVLTEMQEDAARHLKRIGPNAP
ncbi:MAG TPA: hypothetical protein VHN79_02355, partial [Lacunisphaera sp.]|nr:hypothetical protein [Lacunisphaera sp.]